MSIAIFNRVGDVTFEFSLYYERETINYNLWDFNQDTNDYIDYTKNEMEAYINTYN